jgi:hypothetical protein
MLCIEDWWPPYFIKKCGIVGFIAKAMQMVLWALPINQSSMQSIEDQP